MTLSCSIGIALYPDHGVAAKLIAHADAAMYAAKRAGGIAPTASSSRAWTPTRASRSSCCATCACALERGQLELYYQPKIHARERQVTAREALMRWHHPVRGLIGPTCSSRWPSASA